MKLQKIALPLFAFAVLALAGCNASESAGGVKGYLTSHGFAESGITQMSGEDYKKTQSAEFKAEGLKEYLAAVKAPASEKELPEQFYCWFFDTMEQADFFIKDYVSNLYYSLDGRVKDPAMGSRNNCAWAGTNGIAVGLGWTTTAA